MFVYKYGDTGEYINPVRLQPNPQRPGTYLTPPSNTVPVKPPKTMENEAAVVNATLDNWDVVADYRGVKYWLADGSCHEIDQLKVIPPAEALSEPPPPSIEQLKEIERNWRDHELSRSDRCFTPKFGPVDWTQSERKAAQIKMNDYIDLLKQGPNIHPSFPDQSWRPEWPDGVPRPVV